MVGGQHAAALSNALIARGDLCKWNQKMSSKKDHQLFRSIKLIEHYKLTHLYSARLKDDPQVA